MIVREAKYQDSEAIAGFQVEMASETENLQLDVATVKKGVNAVFSDHAKGFYFVAEADNKVVGSVLVTSEWSDWRNGVVWWLQSVYITPEYRGKKIYSKMYKHIQEIVKEKDDVMGIRLYVDNSNKKAQKVYKKLGMDGDHYLTYEWMK